MQRRTVLETLSEVELQQDDNMALEYKDLAQADDQVVPFDGSLNNRDIANEYTLIDPLLLAIDAL